MRGKIHTNTNIMGKPLPQHYDASYEGHQEAEGRPGRISPEEVEAEFTAQHPDRAFKSATEKELAEIGAKLSAQRREEAGEAPLEKKAGTERKPEAWGFEEGKEETKETKKAIKEIGAETREELQNLQYLHIDEGDIIKFSDEEQTQWEVTGVSVDPADPDNTEEDVIHFEASVLEEGGNRVLRAEPKLLQVPRKDIVAALRGLKARGVFESQEKINAKINELSEGDVIFFDDEKETEWEVESKEVVLENNPEKDKITFMVSDKDKNKKFRVDMERDELRELPNVKRIGALKYPHAIELKPVGREVETEEPRAGGMAG